MRPIGRSTGWMTILVSTLIAITTWAVARPLPIANYTIPGVPYSGIYSQGRSTSVQRTHALWMILAYWHTLDPSLPLKDWDELVHDVQGKDLQLDAISVLEEYLTPLGYQVAAVDVSRPSQLKRFINPTERSPVLVRQPLSPTYPGGDLISRVVIGFSDRQRVMVVHDAAFGNNLVISYDDYADMQARSASGRPNAIVIRPRNYRQIVQAAATQDLPEYPERLPIMDQARAVIEKTRYAEELTRGGEVAAAAQVWEQAAIGEQFSLLSPAQQILYRYLWARMYVRLGEHEQALRVIEPAESLVAKLSQPDEHGWPSVDYDNSYLIDLVKADAYLELKDYSRAESSYLSVLTKDAHNARAKKGISEVQKFYR